MRANSTAGEFANSRNRDYLEQYNTERGSFRGSANQVPPRSPVRFVDGEKIEDDGIDWARVWGGPLSDDEGRPGGCPEPVRGRHLGEPQPHGERLACVRPAALGVPRRRAAARDASVVAEKHYAWALAIAAGIATNRDGVLWRYLNSVNDVFKTPRADRDETMRLTHPEVETGAFTYTDRRPRRRRTRTRSSSALGLAPGTTELEHGTKKTGAEACASATG